MTRKEFISRCQSCGYARKSVAEQYAYKNRGREMTEEDFIAVHRLDNNRILKSEQ